MSAMPLFVEEFHGTASAQIDVPAGAAFDLITDIRRLPEWNARIEQVLDAPPGALTEGAEWAVRIHTMGTRWPSRSRVTVIDRATMRFEYTSQSDDGNPSYLVWSWQVVARGAACTVSASWVGRPLTFWRRALLTRVRAPRLAGEVEISLAALAGVLTGAGTATSR